MTAPVDFRLRRSARAKRLRLQVKPGLIELVVPSAFPEAQALAFLHRHRDWAEAKAREFQRKASSAGSSAPFCEQRTISWQGREIPLLIGQHGGRRIEVDVGEALRILLPEGLDPVGRDAAAQNALFAFVKRWLAGRVADLASRYGMPSGLNPREIRIKRMKTRWGSCGPRNDININWLLAFAPPATLEYVVIHELCHIRERNHSQAFWGLVASHCPDYRQHRIWLRSHGAALMQRFGEKS